MMGRNKYRVMVRTTGGAVVLREDLTAYDASSAADLGMLRASIVSDLPVSDLEANVTDEGPALSPREEAFLRHWSRWGMIACYETFIRKAGRVWLVDGFPTTYPTRKEARAQLDRYLGVILDKQAGRL